MLDCQAEFGDFQMPALELILCSDLATTGHLYSLILFWDSVIFVIRAMHTTPHPSPALRYRGNEVGGLKEDNECAEVDKDDVRGAVSFRLII